LRDLTRYRVKLIQHIASEKNRIMRIMEDCNIYSKRINLRKINKNKTFAE